jgi:membrane associated rhomboid family serine protease
MPQLVGQTCVRCGGRIAAQFDARFCGACGCPVHDRCLAADASTGGDGCEICGGPPDHPVAAAVREERRAAAPRKDGQRQPTPPEPVGDLAAADPAGNPSADGGAGRPAAVILAHGHRLRSLIGLVVPILIIVDLLGKGRPATTGTVWMIAFCGLVVAFCLVSLFARPRVVVGGDAVEFKWLSRFRSPVANLQAVAFDGGLVVAFHDLGQVEGAKGPLNAAGRKALADRYARDGVHASLPNFTLGQVEEVRRALGVPAPPPEEPAGRLEQFHRTLLALTPRAFVTYALAAANVAVFAAMVLARVDPVNPGPADLVAWGADLGPLTLGGEWWRLLTCTFIHVGVFHLLVNVAALLSAGVLVERLLGNLGFLVLYLLAGLGGSLVSLAWNPVVLSAGASGAIFGVFGALLGLALLDRQALPPEVTRRLRRGGFTFLLCNVFFGLSTPNVDLAAHAGGFAVGILGGLLFANTAHPEALGRRRWRAAILTVAGPVAVVLAAAALPPPPPEQGRFVLAMVEFPGVEKEVLATFNAALVRAKRGELTDAAFAAVVERDVLPPWRDLRRRLAEAPDVPAPFRQTRPALLDYLQAREDAWDLLVRAIQENNPALAAQARQRAQAAERLLDQLNQTGK